MLQQFAVIHNEDRYFEADKFSYIAKNGNGNYFCEPFEDSGNNAPLPEQPPPTTSDVTYALHPLKIDIILQKVISFLSFEDLVRSSQVCHAWYSNTRIMLEKKSNREFRNLCLVNGSGVDAFFEMEELSFMKRMSFEPSIGEETPSTLNDVRLFLEFKCQHVLEIELKNFANLPTSCLENATKLKALKLIYRSADREGERVSLLHLPTLPQLEKLVIDGRYLKELFDRYGFYSLSFFGIPNTIKSLTFNLGARSVQEAKPHLFDDSRSMKKWLIGYHLEALECLKMDLCTDAHLYFVFNVYKSLKTLTIRNGMLNGFTDKSFVAKSKPTLLTRLSNFAQILKLKNPESPSSADNQKPVKLISGLKHLHKLTISKVVLSFEEVGVLTNAAVRAAIATCVNLKILLTSGFTFQEEDYKVFTVHNFQQQEIFDEFGDNIEEYVNSFQVTICLLVKADYVLQYDDKRCLEEDVEEFLTFYGICPQKSCTAEPQHALLAKDQQ